MCKRFNDKSNGITAIANTKGQNLHEIAILARLNEWLHVFYIVCEQDVMEQ